MAHAERSTIEMDKYNTMIGKARVSAIEVIPKGLCISLSRSHVMNLSVGCPWSSDHPSYAQR